MMLRTIFIEVPKDPTILFADYVNRGTEIPHYVVCELCSLGYKKTPLCCLRTMFIGVPRDPTMLCALCSLGYQKAPLCCLRTMFIGVPKYPTMLFAHCV